VDYGNAAMELSGISWHEGSYLLLARV